MNIKELFTEERAVSPVIGVILMVAITVILAAVIGTFVIGLGEGIGDTAPQASFDAESSNETSINFTHRSGDSIPANESFIVGNSSNIESANVDYVIDDNGRIEIGEELTAGDRVTLNFSSGVSGETISVVYDDGDRSTTLASGEIQ